MWPWWYISSILFGPPYVLYVYTCACFLCVNINNKIVHRHVVYCQLQWIYRTILCTVVRSQHIVSHLHVFDFLNVTVYMYLYMHPFWLLNIFYTLMHQSVDWLSLIQKICVFQVNWKLIAANRHISLLLLLVQLGPTPACIQGLASVLGHNFSKHQLKTIRFSLAIG